MEEEELKMCENCQQQFPSNKIDLHQAYCRRNIHKCKFCFKMVDINDEQSHNNQFHIQKQCDYCHIPVEAPLLPSHMLNCPERPVGCKFCQNPYPQSKITKHESQCGSRTRLCERCRKYIKINTETEHVAQCQGIELLRNEIQEMRRMQPLPLVHNDRPHNPNGRHHIHNDRINSNQHIKKEISQGHSPRRPHKKPSQPLLIEAQPISQLVDPVPISVRLAMQRQREQGRQK